MVWKFCDIWKILWELASRWAKFCEILSHSVRYGMYVQDIFFLSVKNIFWKVYQAVLKLEFVFYMKTDCLPAIGVMLLCKVYYRGVQTQKISKADLGLILWKYLG